MPIPRYQPGSMNLGVANPIADEVGAAYNKGADMVEHPLGALRGMLGMPEQGTHESEVQKMNQQLNDKAVQDANRTFMPAPVVAPPRRKPMGKI